MKIRRYKGPNREDLYRIIHKEMGPNAIVVTPETPSGSRLGRATRHELIAILDDSDIPGPVDPEAERPRESAGAEDFRRFRLQQAQQWRDLQTTLSDIQQTVQTLNTGRTLAHTDPNANDLPEYTRCWDARFRAWAQSVKPELLNQDAQQASQALAASLPVAPSFAFRNATKKPHVIVLVGPTGSGKTTTLAKLAAICAHQERLRIGLVTTDTYRVAAVDQIREYASLLDAELRVAFSAEEARAAVSAMADNDVIFVDTPGRTHLDGMGLAVCQNVLRGMGAVTVLLTIPATLNPTDLPDVIRGFSRFSPNCLVVTKVDETRQPALFTFLRFDTDLRVAFVTNGQRVPQDIFEAQAERIAALLIPIPRRENGSTTDAKDRTRIP